MSNQRASALRANREGSPRHRLTRFRHWWNDFLDRSQASLFGDLAGPRAIQLLKKHLSTQQRDQYERDRSFEVVGCSTGRRYRIRYGYQINVEQLDRAGRCTHLLCFMPEGGLPIGDMLLAQKLALELFEDEAIRVATKVNPLRDRMRVGGY